MERLDQLQIAKSDGLDKNFTRGFKRSRTCFGGEAIAFWRVHIVYIFQSKLNVEIVQPDPQLG